MKLVLKDYVESEVNGYLDEVPQPNAYNFAMYGFA